MYFLFQALCAEHKSAVVRFKQEIQYSIALKIEMRLQFSSCVRISWFGFWFQKSINNCGDDMTTKKGTISIRNTRTHLSILILKMSGGNKLLATNTENRLNYSLKCERFNAHFHGNGNQ